MRLAHRGARRLLARRADRHGSQPALRRPGDHGDQDLRPPVGLAELDLPAPQRDRPGGRAEALRHGQAEPSTTASGLKESRSWPSTTASSSPTTSTSSSDRRLQRALENWQPRFLDWWKDMGPDGTLGLRRLPAHRHLGRRQRLGQFRLREDAGLSLGHLPRRARIPTGVIAYGDNKGKPVWQEVPGELRSTLRRLIVTQGDTEPASVEQQRLLGKTAPSLYDLRNLFQVNCRGRPPPVGDGLSAARLFRPRRPRGGRDAAGAPFGRSRQAAHPRRLQREDAGLALLLHVHLLHRPRRQVPARLARRIGLRSAVALLPLHADRGSAPHVRGRDRRAAASSSAPAS